MALQNAESRGESFSKEDFLEGRVGSRMIPEDFNFEENVRFFTYQLYVNSSLSFIFIFNLTNSSSYFNQLSPIYIFFFKLIFAILERTSIEGTSGSLQE